MVAQDLYFESMGLPACRFDALGRIAAVNAAWRAQFGDAAGPGSVLDKPTPTGTDEVVATVPGPNGASQGYRARLDAAGDA